MEEDEDDKEEVWYFLGSICPRTTAKYDFLVNRSANASDARAAAGRVRPIHNTPEVA